MPVSEWKPRGLYNGHWGPPWSAIPSTSHRVPWCVLLTDPSPLSLLLIILLWPQWHLLFEDAGVLWPQGLHTGYSCCLECLLPKVCMDCFSPPLRLYWRITLSVKPAVMTLPKWQHPQLHSQSVTQFFHDNNNFQNNCTVLILDRPLYPWFSQPSLGGTFWLKWNCWVLNVYGIAKLLFSKASPMNSSTSSLWQCFLPLSAFLIFVNLLSKMQCKCKK